MKRDSGDATKSIVIDQSEFDCNTCYYAGLYETLEEINLRLNDGDIEAAKRWIDEALHNNRRFEMF